MVSCRGIVNARTRILQGAVGRGWIVVGGLPRAGRGSYKALYDGLLVVGGLPRAGRGSYNRGCMTAG
jgi:hypothetical protein